MQQMHPLFRDVNLGRMYFEHHTDSEFELLLQSEEVEEIAEQKPDLLPDRPTMDILHEDYIPDYIPIKLEKECDQNIVGHIIQQPPLLAKSMKQEIIDTAAHNIVQRHSSSCALTQYVQQMDSTLGLQISDIHSLAQADKQVHGIPLVKLEPVSEADDEEPVMPSIPPSTSTDDPMVEPDTPKMLPKVTGSHPAAEPKPAHTPYKQLDVMVWSRIQHRQIPVSQPTHGGVEQCPSTPAIPIAACATTPVPEEGNEPLHVIMAEPDITASDSVPPTMTPLVKSCSSEQESLHEVTPQLDTSNVKTVSSPSSVQTVAKPAPALTATLTLSDATISPSGSIGVPLHKATHQSTPELTSVDDIATVSHKSADLPDSAIFYETLTAKQDDILYISKQDILLCKCTVKLDKLTQDDIQFLCKPSEEGSAVTEPECLEEVNIPDPARKKPTSHRPGRKPSRARLAAQCVISEHNKKILAHEIILKLIRNDPPKPTEMPPDVPTVQSTAQKEDSDNSDDTITYTPPDNPQKKRQSLSSEWLD